MQAFRDALVQLVAGVCATSAQTVRHLFYKAEGQGLGPKSEKFYQEVSRVLTQLRWEKRVAWDDIVDGSRTVTRPRTYASAEEGLRAFARAYRKDIWGQQDAFVQVWTEKDAIAGILLEETWPAGVSLYTARGQAPPGYVRQAAQELVAPLEIGKTVQVLHFGDFDQAGENIGANIERKLRRHLVDLGVSEDDLGTFFEFRTLAVTADQIEEYDLPLRPPKAGDTREAYADGCVEVDALPSEVLRELCRVAIFRDVDRTAWDDEEAQQEREREGMEILPRALARRLSRVA
jgi:hypothetical protein